MDEKSIGMQADTISIEGKKNITLVSGKESMVFSSEKTSSTAVPPISSWRRLRNMT